MTITNKFPAGLDLTTAYYSEHVGLPVVDNTSDLDTLGHIYPAGGQRVDNPFLGQTVLSKLTAFSYNALRQYRAGVPNGSGGTDTSGWLEIAAGDGSTSAARPDARYENIVAQSIPNATDTIVSYASVKYDSDNIFPSGSKGAFAPYYSGLYLVTAGLRLLGNAGGGGRSLWMQVGTSGFSIDATKRVAESLHPNVGSVPVTVSCSAVVRLTYNDWVMIGAYQNCGAALNTDVGFGGTNHVSLTWLRPL